MMIRTLLLSANTLAIACLTVSAIAADRPLEGRLESFLGEPRFRMQPISKEYGRQANGVVALPVGGRDILLYSNCDSPGRDSRVSEADSRNHGTVWVSFDGGGTWPLKRLVHEGPFC